MHLRKLQTQDHSISTWLRAVSRSVRLTSMVLSKEPTLFLRPRFPAPNQAQQGQGQRPWRKHCPKPHTGCLTLDDLFTTNYVFKLSKQTSTDKTKLHGTQLDISCVQKPYKRVVHHMTTLHSCLILRVNTRQNEMAILYLRKYVLTLGNLIKHWEKKEI